MRSARRTFCVLQCAGGTASPILVSSALSAGRMKSTQAQFRERIGFYLFLFFGASLFVNYGMRKATRNVRCKCMMRHQLLMPAWCGALCAIVHIWSESTVRLHHDSGIVQVQSGKRSLGARTNVRQSSISLSEVLRRANRLFSLLGIHFIFCVFLSQFRCY